MFKSSDSINELKIKALNTITRIEYLESMRSVRIKKNFLSGFAHHIFGAFATVPSPALFHHSSSGRDSNRLATQIDIERVKLASIERRIEILLTANGKKSALCKK